MRIQVLPNVIVVFTTTILHIIDVWCRACEQAVSMSYTPTLTSGMEGKHSLLSGHYEGRSVDFRSYDIPFHLRQNVKHAAQELLGADYLVLLEDTHYHIQRSRHAPPHEWSKSVEV